MTRHFSTLLVVGTATATFLAAPASTANDPGPFTAHEWGTFTSIAGPDGRAVEWMPQAGPSDLPCFVQRSLFNVKGSLTGTVRMETPVLYFYSSKETDVSVKVGFPSGTITEWYPAADQRGGEIVWPSVKILPATKGDFPNDGRNSHYYAARNTAAATVQVSNNGIAQQERFLFYRGVANFQPPLSVKLVNNQIVVRNWMEDQPGTIVLFENQGGRIGYRFGQSTGTEGALILDDTHRDAWLNTVADSTRFPMSTMPGEQVDHVFAGQMGPETIHFLEACILDRPVMVTPQSARMVMETYTAADLSAERNAPVDLPLSNESLSQVAEMVGARR